MLRLTLSSGIAGLCAAAKGCHVLLTDLGIVTEQARCALLVDDRELFLSPDCASTAVLETQRAPQHGAADF